jgi:hypothetical protein
MNLPVVPRKHEVAAIAAEFVSAFVKVGLRYDNAAEMEEKVNDLVS